MRDAFGDILPLHGARHFTLILTLANPDNRYAPAWRHRPEFVYRPTQPLWSSLMEANQRIGDYEILGELGRGGMGKVYRVRNVISDRIDAMKVLLPDLIGSPELAARFVRGQRQYAQDDCAPPHIRLIAHPALLPHHRLRHRRADGHAHTAERASAVTGGDL